MTVTAGYLVDLSGYRFDDNGTSTWIHAMTVGEYDHPLHGKIKITPDRIKQFAANVTGRVRETDLDIDYDHKANGGEAAGWVRQADARADGLWLLVEWTSKAYQLLKDKAYRYFSPEFVDEWQSPKSGQKFKDVLFGGGITNRPFLKDILPINMTEIVNGSSGGTSMDPAEVLKQLAKLFGLPEDTDPGVILGHAQAKVNPTDNPDPNDPNDPDKGGDGKPDGDGKPEGLSEDDKDKSKETTQMSEAAIKQLSELPFVKTLMETVAAQGKKLDEADVNESVVKLSEKATSKGVAIPPVIKDGLKKQLSEVAPTQRAGLIQLFDQMIENGQLGVSLSEDGPGRGEHDKTATKKFNDEVAVLTKDGKMTYADAATKIFAEQPTLYTDYQRELASS